MSTPEGIEVKVEGASSSTRMVVDQEDVQLANQKTETTKHHSTKKTRPPSSSHECIHFENVPKTEGSRVYEPTLTTRALVALGKKYIKDFDELVIFQDIKKVLLSRREPKIVDSSSRTCPVRDATAALRLLLDDAMRRQQQDVDRAMTMLSRSP